MAIASRTPMMDVALVAVFAALIAALSVVPGINLGIVPITLQTLAIGLTAMVIGPWRAFAATSLYLLVGFAGLPVFANGASGIGVLARGSAGYLLSFPLYALMVGFLAQMVVRRAPRFRVLWLVVAGLVGSVTLVHPMGIAGLMLNANLPFDKALALDMTFWIGDLIKTTIAASVAVAVHKAFPALLAPRRVPQPAAA